MTTSRGEHRSGERVRRRPGPTGRPLRETHPHLIDQIDPTANIGLDIDSLSAGSAKVIIWRCSAGPDHVWGAEIRDRTLVQARSASGRTVGSGCPFCTNRRLSVTNSIQALYADLASQVDPALNEGRTADQIIAGGRTPIAWRCLEGPDHIWTTTVRHRVAAQSRCVPGRTIGSGCPYCSHKRLSVTNSILALAPNIASQVDPTLNEGRTADQIIGGGTKKVTWRCPEGPDHIWTTTVHSRIIQGSGCPFCANLKLSVTNSIQAVYPHLASQVEPTLNQGRSADQIIAGGITPVAWRCPDNPEHVWSARVNERIARRLTGCPVCHPHGYQPSLPGFIYLLDRTLQGTKQRKIGITNTPEMRLAQLSRVGWQMIDISPALDGHLARKIEQQFLALLDLRGVNRPTRGGPHRDRYSGYTEAWPYAHFPVDSITDVFTAVGHLDESQESSALAATA